MEWADAVAWRAVLCSAAGSADDRIRQWLYHVHVVQRAFLQAWRGEPAAFPDASAFPDLSSLAAWAKEGHAALQSWLASAAPDRLADPLRVPWAEEVETAWQRTVVDPTVGQTAMQVALHSTHHRGQINARLRDLGSEPQHTDFIIWLWFGQPLSDWSFLSHLLPDA
jgi:uncharacterized damage-inducible protein DinB